MPLFELQVMIDLLSLYIHGAPDLTEETSRIAVKVAPHLCLDVQPGTPQQGIIGPLLWLWDARVERPVVGPMTVGVVPFTI